MTSAARSNSQQMGIMRMISAIDVNWVAPLLPKLKDPIDVHKLNNPAAVTTSSRQEVEEESKSSINNNTVLGKRTHQQIDTDTPTVAAAA